MEPIAAADDVFSAGCPKRLVLDHLTSKWGLLILAALHERPHRWGELRTAIGGVSEKMLASTLRTLEHDGLVSRTVTPTTPIRVDYALTPLGEEAAARVVTLVSWASEHTEIIIKHRNQSQDVR